VQAKIDKLTKRVAEEGHLKRGKASFRRDQGKLGKHTRRSKKTNGKKAGPSGGEPESTGKT